MGRFITADSIVPQPFNPQTLNRYSYADNNPINFIDPSGHFSIGKFFKSLFKGLISAFATAILTPFVGPAIAGAIVGAVSGVINGGGLKGALIGAGLGFLGGYAISKDWSALSQAMLAAGAVISTLNGGFEGLINYAATVAGGYYGSKFGNNFNAQNQDTAQQNTHDSTNQLPSSEKVVKSLDQIVKESLARSIAKAEQGLPEGSFVLAADASGDFSYWEAFKYEWTNQAESWTGTMKDLFTGNWDNFESHYANSALGQAESAGGAVYTAEKALLGTAMVTAGGATVVLSTGYSSVVAIHGAHHSFRLLGGARLRHLQITIWKAGVKGSHKILRVPFP